MNLDDEELRDRFAIAALQGIFASENHSDATGDILSCSMEWYRDVAHHAYGMAEAMLTARKGGAA